MCVYTACLRHLPVQPGAEGQGSPVTRAPEQTTSTEAAGGAEGPVMSEELRREFQELGLSPYEARLLLAMVQVGPATTLELAQASGVPRTSTYPVLRGLSEKQLAYRLPSDGPAVYACLGRDEIFARLDALEQERLRQHRQRSQRVRLMLDEAVATPTSAWPNRPTPRRSSPPACPTATAISSTGSLPTWPAASRPACCTRPTRAAGRARPSRRCTLAAKPAPTPAPSTSSPWKWRSSTVKPRC
ncbi:MAG: hypothetical protein BRC31_03830 [Actinobacteria bacterium QS_5_72_10]|nr:MAG: hypothetical protein BRC31_03830 [Actinobacteria bacterium QS_5_72_10]